MSIYTKLLAKEASNEPIRTGIIGAGQMGFGLIAQISQIPGMEVRGICDVNEKAAEKAKSYYQSKSNTEIVTSNKTNDIVFHPDIDVIVDATGIPEVGANISFQALQAKKHLILLNVEIDITIGSVMKQLFDAAGLVYSGSAGDEPAATMELIEFSRTMGLEILVAGKGKNNPYIKTANPDTAAEEAKRKNMNAHMLAAFQDGTKTMAEMNLLSNATGLVPDITGMHGVTADVETVTDELNLQEHGGKLSKFGVVDYVHGLAPGVFVIVKSDLEPVDEELKYLSVGKGPHYTLYRPYHLASLETPISIAKAVLNHESSIYPIEGGPVSETVTVTKKAIQKGENLDGIGGYAVRGVIETATETQNNGHIPVGLISGKTVAKRDIPEGTFVTYEDVELDTSTAVWQLRALQDRTFAPVLKPSKV